VGEKATQLNFGSLSGKAPNNTHLFCIALLLPSCYFFGKCEQLTNTPLKTRLVQNTQLNFGHNERWGYRLMSLSAPRLLALRLTTPLSGWVITR